MSISTPVLVTLLLGSIRAAAWLVFSPPFNSRAFPLKLKALMSVALAMPMIPLLADSAPEPVGAALLVSAVWQVVIGAALGFLTALVFAAVQAAGDLIDIFGYFSAATAFDPMSGSSNSVFGRFYQALAAALLFATDGHQLIVRGFAESYKALPLDASLSMTTMGHLLTGGIGQMFLGALQIAGPLIAVLFLADIGLGLLNRAAPALNVFSVGFPIKIFTAMSLAGTAIAVLPDVVHGLVGQAVRMMMTVTGG